MQQVSTELRTIGLRLQLLDIAGKVPSPLPIAELRQHLATAQILATNTALLSRKFTHGHGNNPSEHTSKAMAELESAVAHTREAVHSFRETVSIAMSPAPKPGTLAASSHEWGLVINHADGRGHLLRASDAVTRAAQHVETHHSVEQYIAQMRGTVPRRPDSPPRSHR
ncbi:hypothetical protein J7I94_02095 [Streptomyces sp. ISL-12]|uniref:hypothetical protein n=1 Tax=Streptomyces sp. ISL-12 TaxID=2819177 RepID=UPI001BE50362|nr:hypothetical protein [Streptomyces sp. ISL-12]MBT2409362.1 hypothetical protein [Streptomyces sp. ISL-12]